MKLTKRIKEYLINYLTPDYYDIKRDNKDLNKDIYNLIVYPNSNAGMVAIIKWRIHYKMEEMIWQGDMTATKNFDGIIKTASYER